MDGELPAHLRTLTRKQAATELQYSPECKFLQDRLQASPVNVDLTLPVEDREKRVGYPIRLLSETSRAVILSMYSVSVHELSTDTEEGRGSSLMNYGNYALAPIVQQTVNGWQVPQEPCVREEARSACLRLQETCKLPAREIIMAFS